jgi:Ser/Thr protein kinase RdoA (MazF antagonist)
MIRSAQKATQFFCDAVHYKVSALGNGLINDTFLVNSEQSTFVLQRINSVVFPHPDQIMENLIQLNQHIAQKNKLDLKIRIPEVIKTISNETHAIDEDKNVWRALEFIDNTVSKESMSHLADAKQLGFALGHFHGLFKDAKLDIFHDTLPDFHITPTYFQRYVSVENKHGHTFNSKQVKQCRDFISIFGIDLNTLENDKKKGYLSESITHGDPKLNNFLFDTDSERVVSLIDLDTVKPGLIHYDIADCLRSCCHINESNFFDMKTCQAILSSYLQETHLFLNDYDYHYLYPSIQLMPFELGLRFFTDYLQGNVYFKVNSPEQNLGRAINQFQLCESITKQELAIKQHIEAIQAEFR